MRDAGSDFHRVSDFLSRLSDSATRRDDVREWRWLVDHCRSLRSENPDGFDRLIAECDRQITRLAPIVVSFTAGGEVVGDVKPHRLAPKARTRKDAILETFDRLSTPGTDALRSMVDDLADALNDDGSMKVRR